MIDGNFSRFFSSRLDLIFMDITKNILHRLDKDKIPSLLLPTVHPGRSLLSDMWIQFTSFSLI